MVSQKMQRIIGVVLVLMAVAIGTQYVVQVNHERRLVECQARINRAFSRVVALRGGLADADRAANRRLLAAVSQAKTAGQVRRAENTYLETQRRLDRKRDAHPYPKVPTEACD